MSQGFQENRARVTSWAGFGTTQKKTHEAPKRDRETPLKNEQNEQNNSI